MGFRAYSCTRAAHRRTTPPGRGAAARPRCHRGLRDAGAVLLGDGPGVRAPDVGQRAGLLRRPRRTTHAAAPLRAGGPPELARRVLGHAGRRALLGRVRADRDRAVLGGAIRKLTPGPPRRAGRLRHLAVLRPAGRGAGRPRRDRLPLDRLRGGVVTRLVRAGTRAARRRRVGPCDERGAEQPGARAPGSDRRACADRAGAARHRGPLRQRDGGAGGGRREGPGRPRVRRAGHWTRSGRPGPVRWRRCVGSSP